MSNQLNFDVEILTSELMKSMNIPISTKKSKARSPFDGNISKLVSDVPVSDLIIDLSYQRKPNSNKVAKIINNYDPNAIGVLVCSMRENGDIAVIDGGHRVAALNAMSLSEMKVRCLVFFDLTIQQEADMFTTLNDNRTKPKTSDIFKSRVIADDDEAVMINNIINLHGLHITNGPAMNGIRAIGTINTIAKRYGMAVLDDTIYVLKKAFGSHSTSFSDQALMATAVIFSNYRKIIDRDRFVSVLMSYGNANIWANKGTMVAKQANFKHMYVGMMFVFAGDYNKRLKKNRIDFTNLMK